MTTSTARAEAIASQVMDLKSTEILVLTVPESLPDDAFGRLRNELQHILNTAGRDTCKLAVVVLREGMTLAEIEPEALKACGLTRVAFLAHIADQPCENGWAKGDCTGKVTCASGPCWPCYARLKLKLPAKNKRSPF